MIYLDFWSYHQLHLQKLVWEISNLELTFLDKKFVSTLGIFSSTVLPILAKKVLNALEISSSFEYIIYIMYTHTQLYKIINTGMHCAFKELTNICKPRNWSVVFTFILVTYFENGTNISELKKIWKIAFRKWFII